MIRGKKGGEKYLSIWWFICLGVIAGGIVVGVWIFYSAEVDIKKLDASILSSRILECIVENGEIISENMGESLFDNCNLNKNILGNPGGNYYFEVSLYDLEGCDENIAGIEKCREEKRAEFGNRFIKTTDCKFQEEGGRGKYLGKCQERRIFVVSDGEMKLLRIFAAANQQGGNREIVQ